MDPSSYQAYLFAWQRHHQQQASATIAALRRPPPPHPAANASRPPPGATGPVAAPQQHICHMCQQHQRQAQAAIAPAPSPDGPAMIAALQKDGHQVIPLEDNSYYVKLKVTAKAPPKPQSVAAPAAPTVQMAEEKDESSSPDDSNSARNDNKSDDDQAGKAAPSQDQLPHSVDDTLLHLRKWIKGEPKLEGDTDKKWKEVILRKVKVAYGVAELLKQHSHFRQNMTYSVETIPSLLEVTMEDFAVHIGPSNVQLNDVKGVAMISAGLTTSWSNGNRVNITSPSPVPASHAGANQYWEGMDVLASAAVRGEEDNQRHLLGRMLFEIFTGEVYPTNVDNEEVIVKESSNKRMKTSHSSSTKDHVMRRAKGDFDDDNVSPVVRLHVLRNSAPASIFWLTKKLLECGLKGDTAETIEPALKLKGHKTSDVYYSFRDVCEDLHLLVMEHRFLFDRELEEDGNVPLLYRTEKLYGRDKEKALVTNSFRRVSQERKSEAILIGGFSGSGKSKLVNSLRDRVNTAGGYLLTYKYDEQSKVVPLFGVVSALNQLCAIIKERNTSEGLIAVTKKLKDAFGEDDWLLASLLPNISLLSSDFIVNEKPAVETINLCSVCFTLARFVRVVSSQVHPIMLFLDDVQWADDTVLDVIHSILSDTMGSCMFFIGTYRDDEVQSNHAIYNFVEKLDASNVPTEKLSLIGLNQEDLNTMISDALCLYPRICKPLSDIVFQKTKGNPFFVLEFMQSLCTRGLLCYNHQQKRWVWNESIIRSEEITDNVKYLLASKLNVLPGNLQGVLKVLACFGTSTSEQLIGYLSETIEYSDIRDQLDDAISGGFIEKDGHGGFKFVHDKVREAAYNLIPTSDKNQFHYDLGKLLHSTCRGKEVGDVQFVIVNQINQGLECIKKDKDAWRMEIVDLNMKAGKRAMDRCIYTAAVSSLDSALSILPEDHWKNLYDLSLELNSMMASASHSAGKSFHAYKALRNISENAICIEEKLESYCLLITILESQGKIEEAFKTCSSVLVELGETLPNLIVSESPTPTALQLINASIGKDTLLKVTSMSNEDLLGMDEIKDERVSKTIKLYSKMALFAYICRPAGMSAFLICKSIQKILENGICKYAPLCFVQYASVIVRMKGKIGTACRIGKMAMAMSKNFDLEDQPKLFFTFYGCVAWRVEPIRSCANSLRQGFESGMTNGDTHTAFHSALQHIQMGFVGGDNLQSLLEDIDYYLTVFAEYNNAMVKNFMLIFRETVSILIDKGEATSIEEKAVYADADAKGSGKDKLIQSSLCHKALRSFWLGHHERCNHYMKDIFTYYTNGSVIELTSRFYNGLNALRLLRKSRISAQNKLFKETMKALKEAEVSSIADFKNKTLLLKAERSSVDEARGSDEAYDDAIESARMNRVIHEEGLACERAGFHYLKCYDLCHRVSFLKKSLEYYSAARTCYQKWGSKMKVDYVDREIEKVKAKMSDLQSKLQSK